MNNVQLGALPTWKAKIDTAFDTAKSITPVKSDVVADFGGGSTSFPKEEDVVVERKDMVYNPTEDMVVKEDMETPNTDETPKDYTSLKLSIPLILLGASVIYFAFFRKKKKS